MSINTYRVQFIWFRVIVPFLFASCSNLLNAQVAPNNIYSVFELDTIVAFDSIHVVPDVYATSAGSLYLVSTDGAFIEMNLNNRKVKRLAMASDATIYPYDIRRFCVKDPYWCMAQNGTYWYGKRVGDTVTFLAKNRFTIGFEATLYAVTDSFVYLGRCYDYQDKEPNSAFYRYDVNTQKTTQVLQWDFDCIALTNYTHVNYLDYMDGKVLMGNSIQYDFTIKALQTGQSWHIQKEGFKRTVTQQKINAINKLGRNTSMTFHFTDQIKKSDNHITYAAFISKDRLFVRYFDKDANKELVDIWKHTGQKWELHQQGLVDTYYKTAGIMDSTITRSNWYLCTYNYPILFANGMLIKLDTQATVYPLGMTYKQYFDISSKIADKKLQVHCYRIKE